MVMSWTTEQVGAVVIETQSIEGKMSSIDKKKGRCFMEGQETDDATEKVESNK